MNLHNFENHISDIILMRGLDYYKSGNIISLEFENHEWLAEVEGSYDYTVTVKLTDSDDIINTYCNCPYDMGVYCKHQVAVFYALKKDKQRNKTKKKPDNKKIDEVVNKLDKQTLVKIILDIANENSHIKDELFLIYGDKGDSKLSSRKIIQASINPFRRYDYIDYDDAWQATKGVETVMRMVDAKIAIGDTETAVTICIVILEEMMEWAEHLSDYCDAAYEIIDNTIEQIRETVESAKIDKKSNAVFEIVYKHAMSDIYDDGLSRRVDLLSAIVPLCDIKTNKDKIEQYITSQKNASDNLDVYEYRALQELQYLILVMHENELIAEEYLQQHIDNPEFRRIAIETAMLEQKYERAEQLCLEGERSCVDYSVVLAFKEYRYNLYGKTMDIAKQTTLAIELLLTGKKNYYHKLKELCNENEWPEILNNILAVLSEKDPGGIYLDIVLNENLKPQLMDYCGENIYLLETYYPKLLPEYSAEIGEMFVAHIFEIEKRASSRSGYRNVCDWIRHYKKVSGNIAAGAMKKELLLRNARRPAFVDELNKL